jgi:hypothetical protein
VSPIAKAQGAIWHIAPSDAAIVAKLNNDGMGRHVVVFPRGVVPVGRNLVPCRIGTITASIDNSRENVVVVSLASTGDAFAGEAWSLLEQWERLVPESQGLLEGTVKPLAVIAPVSFAGRSHAILPQTAFIAYGDALPAEWETGTRPDRIVYEDIYDRETGDFRAYVEKAVLQKQGEYYIAALSLILSMDWRTIDGNYEQLKEMIAQARPGYVRITGEDIQNEGQLISKVQALHVEVLGCYRVAEGTAIDDNLLKSVTARIARTKNEPAYKGIEIDLSQCSNLSSERIAWLLNRMISERPGALLTVVLPQYLERQKTDIKNRISPDIKIAVEKYGSEDETNACIKFRVEHLDDLVRLLRYRGISESALLEIVISGEAANAAALVTIARRLVALMTVTPEMQYAMALHDPVAVPEYTTARMIRGLFDRYRISVENGDFSHAVRDVPPAQFLHDAAQLVGRVDGTMLPAKAKLQLMLQDKNATHTVAPIVAILAGSGKAILAHSLLEQENKRGFSDPKDFEDYASVVWALDSDLPGGIWQKESRDRNMAESIETNRQNISRDPDVQLLAAYANKSVAGSTIEPLLRRLYLRVQGLTQVEDLAVFAQACKAYGGLPYGETYEMIHAAKEKAKSLAGVSGMRPAARLQFYRIIELLGDEQEKHEFPVRIQNRNMQAVMDMLGAG